MRSRAAATGVTRVWALPALVVVIAVARAATAKPIPDAPPATLEQRKAAFATLAGEERTMRRDAAKDFPADAWSQDDAFHNLEYKRARAIAGERGMRLADVLLAIDEGMREHWSQGVWQKPSVPPCRPRPIH